MQLSSNRQQSAPHGIPASPHRAADMQLTSPAFRSLLLKLIRSTERERKIQTAGKIAAIGQ